MITAHPTKYAGTQFRSRLEARWAAFFDLVGWRWDYEPLELRGYIPDFILHLHEPVLVEVKPVVTLDEFRQYETKLETCGWEKDVLLLGTRLWESDAWWDGLSFGWLGDGFWLQDGNEHWIKAWGLARFIGHNAEIHFASDTQSYRCRCCDETRCTGGGGYRLLQSSDDAYERHPEILWRQAGNIVQWQR